MISDLGQEEEQEEKNKDRTQDDDEEDDGGCDLSLRTRTLMNSHRRNLREHIYIYIYDQQG